jgi:hypothetical protein
MTELTKTHRQVQHTDTEQKGQQRLDSASARHAASDTRAAGSAAPSHQAIGAMSCVPHR